MALGSNDLLFSTLRDANVARLPTFRTRHGEIAHSKPDGSDWSPAQWLQAVIGELGEFANIRKKYERGDLSRAEYEKAACKELADVQIYLDLLALRALDTPDGRPHRYGISLGRATIEKFNEVSVRVDSPIYIADDGEWYRRSESWRTNKGKPIFSPENPLVRDAEGWGSHDDLDAFMVGDGGGIGHGDSETIGLSEPLLNAAGFESYVRAMDGDLEESHPAFVAYYDKHEASCSEWSPTPPPGDGWLLAGVFDSEDGPHCVFVRPITKAAG